MYYKNNKKQILNKVNVKMTCTCGSIFRKSDKARHYKTKKHKDYLKNIEV